MHMRSEVAQRGIALLMSLLFLSLLASLAILAMQATATEWRMAGNDLYRNRALAAAEAGVALGTNALLRAAVAALPANIAVTAVPGLPSDSYRVDFAMLGIDLGVERASGGALTGTHYTVHSWGASLRGANADVEAGILIVRDAGGVVLRAERSYWRRMDLE
jgi:type IV pilus assembly protein PilX